MGLIDQEIDVTAASVARQLQAEIRRAGNWCLRGPNSDHCAVFSNAWSGAIFVRHTRRPGLHQHNLPSSRRFTVAREPI